MLSVPTKGIRGRKKNSGSVAQVLADWLELNSIFMNERTTLDEAIDSFTEEEVYTNSDKAFSEIEQAWVEFGKRSKIAGVSYPFKVDRYGIEPIGAWEDFAPYCFQLLLSSLPWLRQEHQQFHQKEYNDQGRLFEELSSIALGTIGFSVHRPGWPPDEQSGVELLVSAVAKFLNESPRLDELDIWFSASAKDEKLDLVASIPIKDTRPAVPVVLIQVASGANWKDKILSPHIDTWASVVAFTTLPQKGFCIPYTLDDSQFKLECKKAGVLFERLRIAGLLSTHSSMALADWSSRASDWMSPFIDKIRDL